MASEAASSLRKILFLLLALIAIGLGVLGILLPGLPTTPFILVAAWAATKSSPRLHAWLAQHPVFGDMIRNWENGHTVSRKAKWSASIVMGLCAVLLLVLVNDWRLPLFGIASMAIVLLWLWQRPEPKPDE